MSKTTQNTFMKLFKTDVSKYIEKKGQFNYLSWAYAVQELKKACPTARWGVTKAEDGSPFFKTIALHGLGLYIFAGEDLPEPDALTPKEEETLCDVAKPHGVAFVNDLKAKVRNMDINANNYEACIEKIQNMKNNTKKEKSNG